MSQLNRWFQVLGDVAWLWANSPMHKEWSVSLLASNVLPAIKHNQYILLKRDGFPVAFCSWANLNIENEVKYIQDVTSLEAEDWNSGERKWIIDWIAPFGDNHLLYKHMRKKFSNDLFRAIRLSDDSTEARIIHVQGGKAKKQETRNLLIKYQSELSDALSMLNSEN